MKTEFDLDTQTELALDFFKKGDLVLAKDLCYTNLSKNTSHAPSLNLLGIILFKEGFLEKSIENLKKAILNTTDKVKDYTFNLAKIYHASKQLQKAAETYQECCEYTTAADLFFFQNNLNHHFTILYKLNRRL